MAEIYKQFRTALLPINIYHLRTADGREVDLLLEREDGFIAIECKMTKKVRNIVICEERSDDAISIFPDKIRLPRPSGS